MGNLDKGPQNRSWKSLAEQKSLLSSALGEGGEELFLWSSLRSILNPEVKKRANYINFLLISMEKFTMFLLFNFFKHYL